MQTLQAMNATNGQALTLDHAGLAALPESHQVPDVGTLAVGRAGRAVRLAGILESIGAPDDARFVHVESADGSFTANLPYDEAHANGLVLYELDGEALPEKFGGPYRLLFPDSTDCSVNVKFLGRIDVVREPGSHTARCADEG